MRLLHDNEAARTKILPTLVRFVSTWEFLSTGTRSRETRKKLWGYLTRYEPSELYNALDTIVALVESSADASFFQAKICFTFGWIFLYKRKFILQRVRKWLIHHYAAYFLRTKKNSFLTLLHDLIFYSCQIKMRFISERNKWFYA